MPITSAATKASTQPANSSSENAQPSPPTTAMPGAANNSHSTARSARVQPAPQWLVPTKTELAMGRGVGARPVVMSISVSSPVEAGCDAVLGAALPHAT